MKKGSTAVGVRGKDVVVLGVEKKAVAKLQVRRHRTKGLKLEVIPHAFDVSSCRRSARSRRSACSMTTC